MSNRSALKIITSEFTKHRMLALFVLFVASVGLFNAFRFGAASLDYYFVRNSIDVWQNNAQVQSKEEYVTARNSIKMANSLHGSNPLYVELNGQIEEWGALSGFGSTATLQQAKIHYLSAVKIRPLWPVTWANLAMLKWRLQEFDTEMLEFLNTADQLGPQKAEVHILFSSLGLALYKANHPYYTEIKDQVWTRLAAGLRSPYSRKSIQTYISQNNSVATVCRWMRTTDRYVYDNFISCPKLKS